MMEQKENFDLIEKEIYKLRNALSKTLLNNLNKSELSNDYLFSLLCYKYYYKNGQDLESNDINGSWTDGRSDGGIDLVCNIQDDIDGQKLVLIQSKFRIDSTNITDIINIFYKMITTYNDFTTSNTTRYSKKLKKILQNKIDEVGDNYTTDLILFTTQNIQNYKSLENEIKKNCILKNFNCFVYNINDIVSTINSVNSKSISVKNDSIKFDRKSGYLKYSCNNEESEDSIVVNISALDLRRIYKTYQSNGLFEQNLRYYVKNKKIDDDIEKSLQKNNEEFWFKNNGIIICCKSFYMKQDTIELEDFSIINGCQTTTLIGTTNFDKDFYLLCKIIKPTKSYENRYDEFISNIAKASNSQKPISAKDLKSNDPRQKKLQRILRDDLDDTGSILLSIKKGEDIKVKQKDKKLNNDEFGQYILSFYLQKPGTARTAKKLVFESENYYKKIFGNPDIYNKKSISNLIEIIQFIKDNFTNKDLEEFVNDGENFIDAITYGTFTVLSLLGFILLVKKGEISMNNKSLNDSKNYIDFIKDNEFIPSDNFYNYIIFKDEKDDNFEKFLTSLIKKLYKVIEESFSKAYEKNKTSVKSMTNFLKNDANYKNFIIKMLYDKYYSTDIDREEFEKLLIIFE